MNTYVQAPLVRQEHKNHSPNTHEEEQHGCELNDLCRQLYKDFKYPGQKAAIKTEQS